MIPKAVVKWLEENNYGRVTARHPLGGGCISNGEILETASGESFFVKTNSHNPTDMFEREMQGLKTLLTPGGPRIPQAYLAGVDFLLLEDLKAAARRGDYWLLFGRQLAALHQHINPQFGFDHDNYIGSTPQPNSWMSDGHQFFSERRLLFQARMARNRGLLGVGELAQVERLVRRLPDLIPQQPASLIHGDLWSGNAMADSNGAPAIIDPAAHYGWAEAELAMTTLFGSFPGAFYRAYQEVRPLAPDFKKRYPIYNLYHLLNHLNLFGAGYLGQVKSILQRFN